MRRPEMCRSRRRVKRRRGAGRGRDGVAAVLSSGMMPASQAGRRVAPVNARNRGPSALFGDRALEGIRRRSVRSGLRTDHTVSALPHVSRPALRGLVCGSRGFASLSRSVDALCVRRFAMYRLTGGVRTRPDRLSDRRLRRAPTTLHAPMVQQRREVTERPAVFSASRGQLE